SGTCPSTRHCPGSNRSALESSPNLIPQGEGRRCPPTQREETPASSTTTLSPSSCEMQPSSRSPSARTSRGRAPWEVAVAHADARQARRKNQVGWSVIKVTSEDWPSKTDHAESRPAPCGAAPESPANLLRTWARPGERPCNSRKG